LRYNIRLIVEPERNLRGGHAAVLGGTLFLGRTAALTGSIFELVELHSRIHFRYFGDSFEEGERIASVKMISPLTYLIALLCDTSLSNIAGGAEAEAAKGEG